MKGRRTPTEILELRGAFIANPQRRRERENEPKNLDPLGGPPAHLAEQEKSAWLQLESEAVDGVLTRSDRAHLEITSGLLALLREAGAAGMPGEKMNLLVRCLGLMGFNPADRSRVSINKSTKPENNPFLKD